MKIPKILLAAAALSACGCASFNYGDVKVEKETAEAMLEDSSLTPFGEIQLVWKNYPYHSPTDAIGGDTTVDEKGNFRSQAVKPVFVSPEDTASLLKRARRVFSEAGLYDKKKGRGTLRLQLTSMNRWTYGDLFRSFLVDTSFVFLIPASLRVNYMISADFDTSTGTAKVETLGQNKTTFHLLLAPLYPVLTPGGREKSLLNQMLWRCATEVYDRLKRAGRAAAEKPAPPAAPATPAAVPAETQDPAVPAVTESPAPLPAAAAAPAAPEPAEPPTSETPDD
ncbi:MAG TPA: hypothetical protein PKI19_00870 [Elusimicrobiales bacterium]|nr:hypothetical protein [Elusimicrobiales bacterium]